MGKVRHDALPEKVQNISENMWAQAETVLRMSNNGSKKRKNATEMPNTVYAIFWLNAIRPKILRIWKPGISTLMRQC